MRPFLVLLFFTASSFIACGQTSRFHQDMATELDSGKYAFAHKQLDRHLQKKPYDYYAYKLRGQAARGLNSQEDALTNFNIYLEYHPEDSEAQFDRAVLRYQTGRFEQAAENFLQLIHKPKAPETTTTVFFQHSSNSNTGTNIFTVQSGVKAVYYYYLGSCYYHQDQPVRAIASFDSALSIAPKTVDYLIARALAWEKTKQFNEAIADYKAALSQAPDHGLAKYNLGNLLNRLGKAAEGAEYLEESINEQPDLAYPYAEKAFRYMQNEKYDIALQEYNKAIAIATENVDYLLNRGKVKVKLADFEGASDDFNRALKLKPENEQVYFNMAIVAYKKGRYREAVKLLDVSIFYYPEYALAYYNRAIAYHSLKENKKACSDIKMAEKLKMEIPEDLQINLCSP